MLRTASTPLGRVWSLLYRLVARAWVTYLAWGERGAAAYERAGAGVGDVLPGLSDVDVAIVLQPDPGSPGAATERSRARWQRLRRRWPGVDLLLDYPRIYEEPELRKAVGSTALTYGLDGPPGAPATRAMAYLTHPEPDLMRTLERPGLFGTTADWRLVRGPDRKPHEPRRDAQQRRLAAWLELAYCWRWAFALCTEPPGPRAATLCVRTISEPARIWLWLERGEPTASRAEALGLASEHLPEEPALERALELQRGLARMPDPPGDRMLPGLVRLSVRIAASVERQLEDADETEVRLAGAEPAALTAPFRDVPGELPLCDWRALVCPRLPDESFDRSPGDPADPDAIAAAAAATDHAPYRVLGAEGLTIWPAPQAPRARMRAVQCRATDPVGFALAAGGRTAVFPRVQGWSAEDVARRAVAEHRAWLTMVPELRPQFHGRAGELGRLFTAARAALLRESLDAGDPELAVTARATADSLAERSSGSRTLVGEALGAYRGWAGGGAQPAAGVVAEMTELVRGLPAYSLGRGAASTR